MQTIDAPRLTIAQSTALDDIKRRVKKSAVVCSDSVKQSRTHAEVALAEALLSGCDLLRARAILGPSQFEKWIADNFKNSDAMTLDKAKVFTTLAASQQHDETLSDRNGLRQAFQQLGIV